MREKLMKYVDGLFRDAPNQPRVNELHDELLQNTLDRYDEERLNGRTEQEAYDAATESIGDIDELLEPLRPKKRRAPILRSIGICLIILSVIPPAIGDMFGGVGDALGPSLMFLFVALGVYLLLYPQGSFNRRAKKLRALSVALYILCVVPPILFEDSIVGGTVGEALGIGLMFTLVAIATVLIVYAAGISEKREKPAQNTDDAAKSPSAAVKKPKSLALRIFASIFWCAAVCVFFLFGFLSGWYLAWMVFPFAGALYDLILGCAGVFKGTGGAKRIAEGILWLLICTAYMILTVKTERWMATWLLFPIGAALNGVLSGIFDMRRGEKG